MTTAAPEPGPHCSKCHSEIYKDKDNIWRALDTGAKAACRKGGPHKVAVEPVEIDWTSWENTLASWSRDAL